jgi:hypothetical protein
MKPPRLPPPGVPPPLADHDDSAVDLPILDTAWDAVAATALKLHYECLAYNNRRRVRWLRRSLIHWCCHRPMRIGCVDYQPKECTFGWARAWNRFAACRICGRTKDMLLFY